MHILFLTENFPPEVNASSTRVFERAVYWVRAGHEVTVLTCFPNFPQGKIYEGYSQRPWCVEWMHGIRVVRVVTYVARNEGVIRRTLDFVSYMVSAILVAPFLRRPDVVVATSPQFFAAVGGWIVSVLRRRPFVFELGDLWPASIRAVGAMRAGLLLRFLERLELFLYRRSAAVVALTEAFKADLVRRGIPAEKVVVVINGVDLPRYSPRPRDPDLEYELGLKSRFVVGYIGTHGMAHALENALRAAARLKEHDNIRFLFVGDGAAKGNLERLARELSLDNVIFVAAQPKEKMPAYWSLCDVALIHLKNDPVFAEVIPSKIFEAMAMGLPLLIAAPEGEATRIVVTRRAGCAVAAEDPEALAGAVVDLALDQERRREFAAASLAAAPYYSRERQALHMEKVLDRVVRGGGPVADVMP